MSQKRQKNETQSKKNRAAGKKQSKWMQRLRSALPMLCLLLVVALVLTPDEAHAIDATGFKAKIQEIKSVLFGPGLYLLLILAFIISIGISAFQRSAMPVVSVVILAVLTLLVDNFLDMVFPTMNQTAHVSNTSPGSGGGDGGQRE